jgi:hypothetical protein
MDVLGATNVEYTWPQLLQAPPCRLRWPVNDINGLYEVWDVLSCLGQRPKRRDAEGVGATEENAQWICGLGSSRAVCLVL